METSIHSTFTFLEHYVLLSFTPCTFIFALFSFSFFLFFGQLMLSLFSESILVFISFLFRGASGHETRDSKDLGQSHPKGMK